MSTLIERIESVRGFAEDLKAVGNERSRFQQLQTRADQVKATATSLNRLVETVRVLRRTNVPFEAPKLTKELKTKPGEMLKAFRADNAATLDDSQFVFTFKTPLETYAGKLRQSLDAAWIAHLGTVVPPINDSTLLTLENAGLKPQVFRIRTVMQQIRERHKQLPAEDAAVKQLSMLGGEAKAAWTELEQVPSVVLAFLRKASRREATFSDLTSEVNDWLTSKGLFAHLRISLGGP